MALQRTTCVNHADRFGHAVCMACRRTVCQECATLFDGVYFCTPCLSKRRGGSAVGGSALAWAGSLLAVAVLFALVPVLLVWSSTLLFRGIR